MAVGIGGLLASLIGGDPASKYLNLANQPNPNPQLQPGAAPSPSGGQGAPSPDQGGQTPPQTSNVSPVSLPAPDPINNASTAQLLLQAQRQEEAAAGFEHGIHEISAGFGTAEIS
jgi:hypothetical protein